MVNRETDTQGTVQSCFIATAAFGTPMAREVQTLREFRDQVLLKHQTGPAFVAWYYRTSPPLAHFISDKPWLRALVRAALRPVIAGARWWLKEHPEHRRRLSRGVEIR